MGMALIAVAAALSAAATPAPAPAPVPVPAPLSVPGAAADLSVTRPADAPQPVALPATKTAEQAAKDKADEVICRREVEIASLVKAKKTCHTRAQWQYIQAETQRQGRDFILKNAECCTVGN